MKPRNRKTMQTTRVVITGLGVAAPNGVGVADFHEAIRTGRSGIRHIERLQDLGFGCQVGGVPPVMEEQKERYLDPLILRQLNADGVLYGCLAGLEAWEHAGLPIEREADAPDWDSGCIFGAGLAGADAEEITPAIFRRKDRRTVAAETGVDEILVVKVVVDAGKKTFYPVFFLVALLLLYMGGIVQYRLVAQNGFGFVAAKVA